MQYFMLFLMNEKKITYLEYSKLFHILIHIIYLQRETIFSLFFPVLKQMNERYHRCVSVCKHIQQRLGITMQNALTPQVVIATADKLIYNYAIEMVSHVKCLKNCFL